jgi:hypothetical protein
MLRKGVTRSLLGSKRSMSMYSSKTESVRSTPVNKYVWLSNLRMVSWSASTCQQCYSQHSHKHSLNADTSFGHLAVSTMHALGNSFENMEDEAEELRSRPCPWLAEVRTSRAQIARSLVGLQLRRSSWLYATTTPMNDSREPFY